MTGGWKCGSPDAADLLLVDRLGRVDVVVHELRELRLQFLAPRTQREVHAPDLRRALPGPAAPVGGSASR